MKMIIAYIQPHRLDPVTRALQHIPHFAGMTVIEGRGFGREKVEEPPTSRREELTDYTEVRRIEVMVSDDSAPMVMEAIEKHARTGLRDDGKIFVVSLEKARRIRTGEEGEAVV